MIKRSFDFLLAGLGLLLLLPLFGLVALLIKMDSPGPVFFRQERIGWLFRPFLIYKFRTMVQDAPLKGGLITAGQDPRITRIGRYLRKTKIDELPQLLNVLKGDMSFVGPRPEVRRFVELFDRDYKEILGVRPGITDLASIEYHQEEAVLGEAVNPEETYITKILPDKIRLAKEYLERSSFFFDLFLIMKTFFRIIGFKD
jgi:lipopolysaccharide/colanic/teichoic acid biosynthesis glycosyltransferase